MYYGIKLTRRMIFVGGLLACSIVEAVRNYRRTEKFDKLINTSLDDEMEIQRLTEKVDKLINTSLDDKMEIQRLTDEAMRSIEEIDRLKTNKAAKEIDDIKTKIEEIRRKIEELGK